MSVAPGAAHEPPRAGQSAPLAGTFSQCLRARDAIEGGRAGGVNVTVVVAAAAVDIIAVVAADDTIVADEAAHHRHYTACTS